MNGGAYKMEKKKWLKQRTEFCFAVSEVEHNVICSRFILNAINASIFEMWSLNF